jgi:thiamine kinase-like enzyme
MLSDIVLKTLADEYDIQPTRCQETHGIMIKSNYVVTDDKGDIWFVKYYPLAFGESDLARLGQIYCLLEQYSVPTCKVRENIKTRKLYMRACSGFYLVYNFINADVADSRSVIKITDTLRKLHGISDASFKMILGSTHNRIQFARSVYSKLPYPQYQLFKTYLGDKVEEIGRLLNMPVWPCNAVIHGDLNLRNILVKGDEIYFIDLDEIRLGDPIEDLASLIYSLLYRNGVLDFQSSHDIRSLMSHFFYGMLTPENIDKTEHVLKVNCIVYLMQRADDYVYLIRHKSTRKFMDSLLAILSNNVVAKLCAHDI